jgi:hypothetical protein
VTNGKYQFRGTYKEYLNTSYWKEYAAELKMERGSQCEICKATRDLQVHHNVYHDASGTLLGRERERPDLMRVLCEDCHRNAHGLLQIRPDEIVEASLEPWVTQEDEERELMRECGLLEPEQDLIADEEDEREMLMDLGLDPDNPDYSELAPHGMSGDEDDDEMTEEVGTIIEDYIDDDSYKDGLDDDDFEDDLDDDLDDDE